MPPEQREQFEKAFDLIKVDESLGIVYGWGAIFTEDGEEYFDTQGDAIDPGGAEAAALDFMKHSRVAGDLHQTECGTIPFCMPITAEVAKALELTTSRTGLAIGMQPSPEVFAKFKSGEYTGFSIGGTRVEEIVVEKGGQKSAKPGTICKKGGVYRQGKRRRMTKWHLDEISAVDFPAQVGAKAVLLKRKGEPGYDPDNKDPKKRGRLDEVLAKRAMLTGAAEGHSHLLIIDPEDGTGARPAGETMMGGLDFHVHPWVMNSDGDIEIGAAAGHTHASGTISTTQEMAMNSLLGKRERNMPPLTNEEIAKRQARIEKIACLTDVRKTHFLGLEGDLADKFLEKSSADQDADIAALEKSLGDGDTIYTANDGTIYKKGDDPRLVSMAKQRDKDSAELAKMRAVNEDNALAKRADTELPNLPGTSTERGQLLKAIDGIADKDTRENVMKAVAAGDKAIKAAFSTVGSNLGGGDGSAQDELDQLAKAHQKDNPDVDYYTAYDLVAKANPQLAKRAIAGDDSE